MKVSRRMKAPRRQGLPLYNTPTITHTWSRQTNKVDTVHHDSRLSS
jgi:hypothetical protein